MRLTILTLLLIVAISINSVHSSLQQVFTIHSMGNILVQDNFANTIFFEYGAESGVLQPPMDLIGPYGSGDKSGSYTAITSSVARTGTKAVEIYQKAPPKSDAQRRVLLDKFQLDFSPKHREYYFSWWVYFPDESPWNTDDPDSWGTNIYENKIQFGPPDNRHQWHTAIVFRIDPHDRHIYLSYKWHKYPAIGVRKDWNYHSNFYVDEHLNEWIHLQYYEKITTGSESVIRAWINNDMFMEKTTWTDTVDGVTIKCAAPEGYPEWDEYDCDWYRSSAEGYPVSSIKLYDDSDSKEKRYYVDDIVWATEKVPETYKVVDK